MVSRDFSGEEIVNVLQKFGYRHDRTRGDHAILKYKHPETDVKRTVTVPLHDQWVGGGHPSLADSPSFGNAYTISTVNADT